MNDTPTFVLSLDFELRWGSRDRFGLDPEVYRANLEGVAEVVPGLLRLFAERGLRATWATVGALACHDWDEYFARAPCPAPRVDRRFHLGPRYAAIDPRGRLHFAPGLVERIAGAEGQELATHTFSHVPFALPGMTARDVAADLAAVAALWTERFGAPPRSLVFPRNQAAHLEAVQAAGILIWRTNPEIWFQQPSPRSANVAVTRMRRLIDDLGPGAAPTPGLRGRATTASAFVRADLPAPLWRLFVRRVRRTVERLAPGQILHLYWHPHNLGDAPAMRLARIAEVLDLVAARLARGEIESRTMADLAARIPARAIAA